MHQYFNLSTKRRGLWVCFAALLLLVGAQAAQAQTQYQTTSDWGTGFNGQLTLTNSNAQSLSNWTVEFDFSPNITSIWDAKISSHVGKHYLIKSAGWNDVIAGGKQISFGFGGTPGKVTTGPTNIALRGTFPSTPTPTLAPLPAATPIPIVVPLPTAMPTPQPNPIGTGIAVTITQSSRWSGGFGANLDIVNNGTQTVNGWTLRFDFAPSIQSLWNGLITTQGNTYTVKNESWNGTIAPGGKVTLGFSGSGELSASSASNGTFNGVPCSLITVPGSSSPGTTGNSIVIGGGIDANSEAPQITIGQGITTLPLSMSGGGTASFTVASNNPGVATAQVVNGALQLNGRSTGRAGLRLGSGTTARYVGVRVRGADGSLPGWPARLTLGSVSEDTDDHLNFWHSFESGDKNRYVDARYIYLNGGPYYGWSSWTDTPGGRAIRYIRESKKWA